MWHLAVAAKKYYDLEDKLTHCYSKLCHVTATPNDIQEVNTSLQWKFDKEKKNHLVTRRELYLAYSMLSNCYIEYSNLQYEVQN